MLISVFHLYSIEGKKHGQKPEAFENFKALENHKRRGILRLSGEKKDLSFTEVLNASRIPYSPTLSYHLSELAPFIERKEGKHQLMPFEKDAHSLLL